MKGIMIMIIVINNIILADNKQQRSNLRIHGESYENLFVKTLY